jgi:hypothetical protein
VDNTLRYISKEISALNLWAERMGIQLDIPVANEFGNKKLNEKYDVLARVVSRNHFCRLVSNEIFFEIKIDELFWVGKTGNIGFDYISAFQFRNDASRSRWMPKNGAFVDVSSHADFMRDIEVLSFGKLFQTVADLHVFTVFSEKGQPLIVEAITSSDLIRLRPHFEEKFSLRINNKVDYESKTDSWESAVYLANPFVDEFISAALITPENFVEKMNVHEIRKLAQRSKEQNREDSVVSRHPFAGKSFRPRE